MLPPAVKQSLLAHLAGIKKDIESGEDPKKIMDKLRRSMQVWKAAEGGWCAFCGLPVGHRPTARCTGLELEREAGS